MARSRRIDGPYELHPNVHLLTSKDAPDAPLQRAGHGQIVETPDGQVYHTHLCSRPLQGLRRSPLGRETAIQKCVWATTTGSISPTAAKFPPSTSLRRFRPKRRRGRARRRPPSRRARLPLDFQWLRTPHPERIFSLSARPGWLRLIARESIGSWFEQALVARRQEHFVFRAETEVDFRPWSFQQAAGLTAYYNRYKFHFLAVTWHETLGRALTILSCAGDYPEGQLAFPLSPPVALDAEAPVRLALSVDHARLQFSYAGAANGATSGRRSTPRSCRTKREAASIAPSPALSSAWRRSTRRAAPRRGLPVFRI